MHASVTASIIQAPLGHRRIRVTAIRIEHNGYPVLLRPVHSPFYQETAKILRLDRRQEPVMQAAPAPFQTLLPVSQTVLEKKGGWGELHTHFADSELESRGITVIRRSELRGKAGAVKSQSGHGMRKKAQLDHGHGNRKEVKETLEHYSDYLRGLRFGQTGKFVGKGKSASWKNQRKNRFKTH